MMTPTPKTMRSNRAEPPVEPVLGVLGVIDRGLD
jgi:hypothetical protein